MDFLPQLKELVIKSVQEKTANFNAGLTKKHLHNTVDDSQKILNELELLWNTQQVNELLNGRMSIPYNLISEHLSKQAMDTSINNISINYLETENLLLITAEHKIWGKIFFKGNFTKFIHNSTESHFVFQVIEKRLSDKNCFINIILNTGIFLFSSIWGNLEKDIQGIHITFDNHTLEADFKSFIAESEWGQKKFLNRPIIDIIDIYALETTPKGICMQTNLNVSEKILTLLRTYTKTSSIATIASKTLNEAIRKQ